MPRRTPRGLRHHRARHRRPPVESLPFGGEPLRAVEPWVERHPQPHRRSSLPAEASGEGGPSLDPFRPRPPPACPACPEPVEGSLSKGRLISSLALLASVLPTPAPHLPVPALSRPRAGSPLPSLRPDLSPSPPHCTLIASPDASQTPLPSSPHPSLSARAAFILQPHGYNPLSLNRLCPEREPSPFRDLVRLARWMNQDGGRTQDDALPR